VLLDMWSFYINTNTESILVSPIGGLKPLRETRLSLRTKVRGLAAGS
jgi:hypothetical protein